MKNSIHFFLILFIFVCVQWAGFISAHGDCEAGQQGGG